MENNNFFFFYWLLENCSIIKEEFDKFDKDKKLLYIKLYQDNKKYKF